MQRIVIVGGGAGGLELATKLGNTLGKKKQAEIMLVDANPTHLWKPLLHEVATGALDSGADELNYSAHATQHHFSFRLGRMHGLDRAAKKVQLEAIYDTKGQEILPERLLSYDQLVIAIGSITNDFGTQGADQYCTFLDSRKEAEKFHQELLNEFLRASNQQDPQPLEIAIVGAGATGVELSAELYNTADVLGRYGIRHASSKLLKVNLIEAGERILPALPARISNAATFELEKLGVRVRTNTMVTQVTQDGFINKDGEVIAGRLKVWAAGVKAPSFLSQLGLKTNRANQIIVNGQLQTEDKNIYAMGDCSSFTSADGKVVPPRAQAANQQATHLARVLLLGKKGKKPKDFIYRDKGSLVSLSRYAAVGSLMGNLTGASLMIEGRIARLVYTSLYRLHQAALHGYFKTILLTLTHRIHRIIKPRLKLH